MQKLKEKGRYYELPIEGCKILKIIFDGHICIVFDDEHQSYLDLSSEFEIQKYNQTAILNPKNLETFTLFYDLWHTNVIVKEAKANKDGFLFLTFKNGFEISVENTPCNSWQFTIKDAENKNNNLFVYNCCGSIFF